MKIQQNRNTLDKRSLLLLLFFFVLAIGVCAMWCYFGGWAELHSASQSNAKFDAMSALASALAFVGMLCTILLQQEELKATREELAKSAQASQESSELAKAQLRAGYLSAVMQHDMTKIMNLSKLLHENKENPCASDKLDSIMEAYNAALHEYDVLTKAYKAENAPQPHA